jgi:hypothetical protein
MARITRPVWRWTPSQIQKLLWVRQAWSACLMASVTEAASAAAAEAAAAAPPPPAPAAATTLVGAWLFLRQALTERGVGRHVRRRQRGGGRSALLICAACNVVVHIAQGRLRRVPPLPPSLVTLYLFRLAPLRFPSSSSSSSSSSSTFAYSLHFITHAPHNVCTHVQQSST